MAGLHFHTEDEGHAGEDGRAGLLAVAGDFGAGGEVEHTDAAAVNKEKVVVNGVHDTTIVNGAGSHEENGFGRLGVRMEKKRNNECGLATLEAFGLLEAEEVLLPVKLIDETPVRVFGETVGSEGVQNHRHRPGLALRVMLGRNTHFQKGVTHVQTALEPAAIRLLVTPTASHHHLHRAIVKVPQQLSEGADRQLLQRNGAAVEQTADQTHLVHHLVFA